MCQDVLSPWVLAMSLSCVSVLQVHNEAELLRVLRVDGIDDQMIGINNRDLTTFKVDLNTTKKILESEAGRQVTEALWILPWPQPGHKIKFR